MFCIQGVVNHVICDDQWAFAFDLLVAEELTCKSVYAEIIFDAKHFKCVIFPGFTKPKVEEQKLKSQRY